MATAGPISAISALAEKGENAACAECRDSPTTVASLDTGGTFVCNACAIVYRQIGLKTKSIERDRWQEDEVGQMEGNLAVAQRLERNLPVFYRRPRPRGDAEAVRHQFILAKYKRKEFTDPGLQVAYHKLGGGFRKQGQLMKRLKDSNKYMPRHFELSERENFLRYFVKDSHREPKAAIPIDHVNVTMLGHLVDDGHPNLMHIMFPDGGKTRSLYVYHEEEAEIIGWYNAVRGCKYYRYRMSLISAEDLRRLPLTYDCAMADWLTKTGPNQTEAWKRRWCFLLRRSLYYFATYMEPVAKGEVWLGERPQYSVEPGPPANFKKKPVGHIFTLRTPDREFVFSADSHDACRRWVQAIEDVLDLPPTPQDFLFASSRATL